MKFIVPGFEIIYCCFDIFLFSSFVFSQSMNRGLGVRLLLLIFGILQAKIYLMSIPVKVRLVMTICCNNI